MRGLVKEMVYFQQTFWVQRVIDAFEEDSEIEDNYDNQMLWINIIILTMLQASNIETPELTNKKIQTNWCTCTDQINLPKAFRAQSQLQPQEFSEKNLSCRKFLYPLYNRAE